MYHTGDLGRRDIDGYIYVVGRKKDMLKVGANRISPKEIEEALMTSENIEEVAVIGVEDEILGEAIKAYIVFKGHETISVNELKKFCQTKLAPFKIPKYFKQIDELPKNQSGKVMKEELKKLEN